MNLKELIKNHQQKIVISIALLLVASLGIIFGRITAPKFSPPDIRVEQAYSVPLDNSQNPAPAQTVQATQVQNSCEGKIKGTSSLLYHVPGGAFYDKVTKPIRCFDTEAQSQAAGFTKSSR